MVLRVGSRFRWCTGQFRSQRRLPTCSCGPDASGSVPHFNPPPRQSDYTAHWERRGQPSAERTLIGTLIRFLSRVAPALRERHLELFTRRQTLLRRQNFRHLPSHFHARRRSRRRPESPTKVPNRTHNRIVGQEISPTPPGWSSPLRSALEPAPRQPRRHQP
jgi:hypothetical protein